MKSYRKIIITSIVAAVGLIAFLYLLGVISQVMTNYSIWLNTNGYTGTALMPPVNWNPLTCINYAFTANGLKAFIAIAVIALVVFLIFKLYNRFGNKVQDERGFAKSDKGTYGTASWMDEKEMNEILELNTPQKVEGIILGEHKGKIVSVPKETLLNRHVAVFGASGTMKSRAIIRNALFQALRQGESVVITDPKGEMYEDTAELYRQNGYDVKVYNLVNPEHSDSWNCMADLHGDTLLAQVLTNVIIGNTSSGKADHFWDNGEGNLLKALILYTDLHYAFETEDKNLPQVYHFLTETDEKTLRKLFDCISPGHPALASYNLFAQASDTVRSGIKLGLGTRLQVLQNEAVKNICCRSDIDLTMPARKKCAYYIILSDQDTTMSFLSSLFFSFLFIKLTRYADSRPNRRCDVPVNLILDEFNNVGRIGGAADGSDFARSLSVCRSRDIRVMLAVQSLGQLQNRYPMNLWSEIIGNCDIQLMLGCTDDITAKYFSERSGDMSVEFNTTMTERRTLAIAQIIPQYRHMESVGSRKLLTPDEVLRLNTNELLCVIRGHNILRLNKWDYTNHPVSGLIQKKSVYEYKPNPTQYIAGKKIDMETGEIIEDKQESVIETEVEEAEQLTYYESLSPPSDY